MSLAAKVGKKISATTSEAMSDQEMGRPTCFISTLVLRSPSMKARGKKTTMEVKVAVSTAMPTSLAPMDAASCALSPMSLRRAMDSITTTALSTSMPMPRVKPARETRLRVSPLK